jgi:membrane protease YdiL (CAAX protease family)
VNGIVVSGMVTLAAVVMLLLGRYTQSLSLRLVRLDYINSQLLYQMLLLALSFFFLFLLSAAEPVAFSLFVSPGSISAPACGVAWLGIHDGDSWLGLGTSLSVTVTLATTFFLVLRFRKERNGMRQIWGYLFWILLFALTNSFSEEVIFRLGVIVPLAGNVDPNIIMLLSAVIFGVPHLRGMPNGPVGALMAGFLGWLLAKSLLETHGMFWAWLIHFLQDVVIFIALLLSALHNSGDEGDPAEPAKGR